MDQACQYDQEKAESKLEECYEKGYKIRPVYPGLGDSPDPESIYIGAITEGGLYLYK